MRSNQGKRLPPPPLFAKLSEMRSRKSKPQDKQVRRRGTKQGKRCRSDELAWVPLAINYDEVGTCGPFSFLFLLYFINNIIGISQTLPFSDQFYQIERNLQTLLFVTTQGHRSFWARIMMLAWNKATFVVYAAWGDPSQSPFNCTDAATCWVLSHNGKRVGVTVLHLIQNQGVFQYEFSGLFSCCVVLCCCMLY